MSASALIYLIVGAAMASTSSERRPQHDPIAPEPLLHRRIPPLNPLWKVDARFKAEGELSRRQDCSATQQSCGNGCCKIGRALRALIEPSLTSCFKDMFVMNPRCVVQPDRVVVAILSAPMPIYPCFVVGHFQFAAVYISQVIQDCVKSNSSFNTARDAICVEGGCIGTSLDNGFDSAISSRRSTTIGTTSATTEASSSIVSNSLSGELSTSSIEETSNTILTSMQAITSQMPVTTLISTTVSPGSLTTSSQSSASLPASASANTSGSTMRLTMDAFMLATCLIVFFACFIL